MNCCCYCARPIDRAPYDGNLRLCDRCRESVPKVDAAASKPMSIADYWSKPPAEQRRVRDAVKQETIPSQCVVLFDHPYLKDEV